MRRSIIYSYSKEQLKELIQKSNSILEIMREIGISDTGNGSRKILFRIIKEYGLEEELNELRIRTKTLQKKNLVPLKEKLTFEEMFCEDSKVARKEVKRHILKKNLIPYVCSECGNVGEWNGKKLSLQLDHINGVSNDNRLENLRFLCPNCHSQTETFCGRKAKVVKAKKEDLLEIERWKQIEESNIDFSKFGWGTELSKLFKISPQKTLVYVKKHYKDFYSSCYNYKKQKWVQ